MKSLFAIPMLLLMILVVTPQDSFAQRVVKSRKRTTVVVRKTPRSKVVYVNRRSKVRTLRVLPRAARAVRFGRTSFYVANGVYYRKSATGFVIVKAPVGVRVTRLPAKRKRVIFGSATYYYAAGTFYQKQAGNYIVVAAPAGALLYDVSADVDKVKIDGEVYYEYADVIYEKIKTPNGVAYRVVGEVG